MSNIAIFAQANATSNDLELRNATSPKVQR